MVGYCVTVDLRTSYVHTVIYIQLLYIYVFFLNTYTKVMKMNVDIITFDICQRCKNEKKCGVFFVFFFLTNITFKIYVYRFP